MTTQMPRREGGREGGGLSPGMGKATAFIMLLQVAESEYEVERPRGRAATSVGKAGPCLEMESILQVYVRFNRGVYVIFI